MSRRIPSLAVLAAGYVAGAVPFANIAARRRAGIDLRSHGTGTVSGTGLYEVAGFAPLAAFGVLEVAKGAVGPLLAGRHRPGLAAVQPVHAAHAMVVSVHGRASQAGLEILRAGGNAACSVAAA